MASTNRCPKCRQTIHPFAATCPACGADLDAHHRRAAGWQRRRQIEIPRLASDVTDLVVVTLIMLLLALYAPLFGALLALFIVWHAHHNGPVARRNIAIVCAAIAIFNLAAPEVLLPHLVCATTWACPHASHRRAVLGARRRRRRSVADHASAGLYMGIGAR